MSNEVTKPQAFQAMTADLQVSMDDVVSAFVSQYESNLYARKKEITKDIRDWEKQLEDLNKKVRAAVSGDEFQVTLPLGLKVSVGEGKISFEGKEVSFSVEVKDKNGSRWNNSITLNKTKPIPKRFLTEHKGIVQALNDLRAELSEVLVNLKTVARKERQVRGKIAVRKLEDAGYASLMADPELIQLVQLEEE